MLLRSPHPASLRPAYRRNCTSRLCICACRVRSAARALIRRGGARRSALPVCLRRPCARAGHCRVAGRAAMMQDLLAPYQRHQHCDDAEDYRCDRRPVCPLGVPAQFLSSRPPSLRVLAHPAKSYAALMLGAHASRLNATSGGRLTRRFETEFKRRGGSTGRLDRRFVARSKETTNAEILLQRRT